MDTEERVALLEKRLAEHDRLIQKLVAIAKLTPAGRMLLKAVGL